MAGLKETVACAFSTSLDAMRRCEDDVRRIAEGKLDASFFELRKEWVHRWRERIEWLQREFLPSGSGLDNGVQLDTDASKPDRLVFLAPYHAMDSRGMYDGWRDLKVTARPSLIHGIVVDVTGRADESIKDYVADVMREALRAEHDKDSLYPAHWSRGQVAVEG